MRREEAPAAGGLGLAAQAVVIVAVFAVLLVGMVAFAARQEAIDAAVAADASAAAQTEPPAASVAPRPTPTPVPPPDAAGPDTYTVQAGDSLFSVAADLGLDPKELVHWNRDTYPTLETTPALKAGWVLRTTGPPLDAPEPQVAETVEPGIGGVGPEAFPASASVTVTYYAVSGSTPGQLYDSMESNGPWSEWLGERADASVETDASFNFRFLDTATGCSVVITSDVPVTATYLVTLPSWTPPAGVSQVMVDWWIATLNETVAHEAHHIELYESYFAQMNDVVRTGTCDVVEAEVTRLAAEARRANCEFDLAEYGSAFGLTADSCVLD